MVASRRRIERQNRVWLQWKRSQRGGRVWMESQRISRKKTLFGAGVDPFRRDDWLGKIEPGRRGNIPQPFAGRGLGFSIASAGSPKTIHLWCGVIDVGGAALDFRPLGGSIMGGLQMGGWNFQSPSFAASYRQ